MVIDGEVIRSTGNNKGGKFKVAFHGFSLENVPADAVASSGKHSLPPPTP